MLKHFKQRKYLTLLKQSGELGYNPVWLDWTLSKWIWNHRLYHQSYGASVARTLLFLQNKLISNWLKKLLSSILKVKMQFHHLMKRAVGNRDHVVLCFLYLTSGSKVQILVPTFWTIEQMKQVDHWRTKQQWAGGLARQGGHSQTRQGGSWLKKRNNNGEIAQ